MYITENITIGNYNKINIFIREVEEFQYLFMIIKILSFIFLNEKINIAEKITVEEKVHFVGTPNAYINCNDHKLLFFI